MAGLHSNQSGDTSISTCLICWFYPWIDYQVERLLGWSTNLQLHWCFPDKTGYCWQGCFGCEVKLKLSMDLSGSYNDLKYVFSKSKQRNKIHIFQWFSIWNLVKKQQCALKRTNLKYKEYKKKQWKHNGTWNVFHGVVIPPRTLYKCFLTFTQYQLWAADQFKTFKMSLSQEKRTI